MSRGRFGSAGLVGSLLGALLVLLGAVAVPAQAAGYRYWSFWERDGGAWTYATMGPSQTRPDDGAVQGFRFAVSADSKDATQPRGATGFDAVCGDTKAEAGKKRIALVLDFGTAADAPDGENPPKPRTECAQVGEDASSADALASVAKPLRYDSSAMLCAVAGYPRSGCGEQVGGAKSATPQTSKPKSSADPGGSGPAVGIVAGVAAVAVLGGAAVWQARRRRG